MANSPQARKRVRQNEVAYERNRSVRSALRTEMKKLVKLIRDGEKDKALEQIRTVESKADKAAKRNIIHTKAADRIKSRAKSKISAIA